MLILSTAPNLIGCKFSTKVSFLKNSATKKGMKLILCIHVNGISFFMNFFLFQFDKNSGAGCSKLTTSLVNVSLKFHT